MELFKLFGSIFVDNEKANESIAKTDESAGKTAGTLSKLGGVAKVAGGVVATGVGVAAGAMGALFGRTMEASAEINKFSQVAGMSTTGFQQWDYVMKSFGYSVEQASGDMAALAEKAMDAQSGVGENADIFRELGVSVEDSSGKLKTQEQLFDEVILGLQGMEDVTRRNALATMLMSTTGEELAPVLNMTNEELQKMKGNANVISEDDLKKAEDFKLKWDNAKNTLSAVVTEVGINLMPMFQGLLDWVVKHLPEIQKTFDVAFKAIETVALSVKKFFEVYLLPIFQKLFDDAQSNMPKVKAFFEDVFGAIERVANKVWNFFKVNFLPILISIYEYIQSKLPQIRSMYESVFGAISNVVKIAWNLFENLFLPVLQALWDFIRPTFPLIGSIIKTAFDTVISITQGVIKIFEKVTGAIKTAVDWLTSWNDKPAKKKTVEIEERRTTSSSKTPKYASGTNFHEGGLALVGEQGAELVDLPQGSKVYTANQTKGMLGGNSFNFERMFEGANFVVRNDYDIKKITEDFYNVIQSSALAKGVKV